MKKIILFYFLIFNFLYSNSLNLTQEEKDYISSKKTIKVQNEKNWPPYNFNENEIAKGFSIDYTNLIAKKLGLKVEYIKGYSWDEYMEQLKNSELDVINNISKNKKREAFISFTKVFHTAANAIYVKEGSEDLDSLEKLKNKTIIMPKGFFAQQFIEKHYPDIKQILVKDSLEALRQLSLGKADATIGKKNVIDYIISTNNVSGVIPSNFVDDNRMVSLIRMGVPKKETILRDVLQKAQNDVSDEELLALKRKWFGINNQKQIKALSLSIKEKKYLRSKKSINVCSNPALKPFEYLNENKKLEGMNIEILQNILQKLGLSLSYIPTNSLEESLKYLSLNKCDLIPSIDNSNLILDNATLTNPILNYQLAIITKKDRPVISSLESIIDETISLKKDSLLIKDFKSNHPNTNIIETINDKQSLDFVREGKSEYTLLPLPTASYYMSKYAMNNLYISRYSHLSYNLHMAVNNKESLLLPIINKAIKNISDDEKRAIENRWTAVAIEEKIDSDLIAKIVASIIFVISIVLYRQSILNKHNNQLKKANKEIAQLSSTLEKRVQEEVEKNRQKTNQLIYQARLAQMGELINMIAHQWRQPLTAISATTNNILLQLMIRKDVNITELEKELTLLNDYSQYLSSTIDDFRNFYKKDKEKTNISFKEIIEKSLLIIEPSLKKYDIVVEQRLNDELSFKSYPTEITQVVLNILKNAEDTLVDKKIVNPTISISSYLTQKYICLEIEDNAGGIINENKDKIFDPYFSTKNKKDGTGIGLYMSKIIITEHCDGILSVENTKKGACFKISIPKDKNG